MVRYGFLVLTLLIGFAGLFASYCRAQRRNSEEQSRSVWDYVLLWPLLFSKTSTVWESSQNDKPLPAARKIVGWLGVLVLIVVAVIFSW